MLRVLQVVVVLQQVFALIQTVLSKWLNDSQVVEVSCVGSFSPKQPFHYFSSHKRIRWLEVKNPEDSITNRSKFSYKAARRATTPLNCLSYLIAFITPVKG